MKMKKIEFNFYTNPRTGASQIQLLDEDLQVIAILDQRDFAEMKRQQKSPESFQHIVDYCNKYKATNIGEFEAVVF